MSTGIEIRPLRSDDATALSDAFASMNKQAELFDRYAAEEQAGHRACWVATVHGEYAGYVTLVWEATYPGIAGKKIPDIQDLNVVPYLRRRGVASRLLDRAEQEASERSSVVSIGVGLHPGYNAAQVLYVKRGYVPDGLGVSYDGRFVQEGETAVFDDSLVLHFLKELPL